MEKVDVQTTEKADVSSENIKADVNWHLVSVVLGPAETRSRLNAEWSTYALVGALVGASGFSVLVAGPMAGASNNFKLAHGLLFGVGCSSCLMCVWFSSRLIAYLNVIENTFVVEATDKVFQHAIGPNFQFMFIGVLFTFAGIVATGFQYSTWIGLLLGLATLVPIVSIMRFECRNGPFLWASIHRRAAVLEQRACENPVAVEIAATAL